jgi:membrane protein DedA with SNARE-associated domain
MIVLSALTGIFMGSTIALAWGFRRQRNLINHFRKIMKIQEMSH